MWQHCNNYLLLGEFLLAAKRLLLLGRAPTCSPYRLLFLGMVPTQRGLFSWVGSYSTQ